MNCFQMHRLICALLLLGCLGLTACVQTPNYMYDWESYEDQIYAMYIDPGKVPVEKQIENMEANIQRNAASPATTPPGFRAHLGYLYFQTGKLDLAARAFEGEKIAFPESAKFVDRMIARIQLKEAKK